MPGYLLDTVDTLLLSFLLKILSRRFFSFQCIQYSRGNNVSSFCYLHLSFHWFFGWVSRVPFSYLTAPQSLCQSPGKLVASWGRLLTFGRAIRHHLRAVPWEVLINTDRFLTALRAPWKRRGQGSPQIQIAPWNSTVLEIKILTMTRTKWPGSLYSIFERANMSVLKSPAQRLVKGESLLPQSWRKKRTF